MGSVSLGEREKEKIYRLGIDHVDVQLCLEKKLHFMIRYTTGSPSRKYLVSRIILTSFKNTVLVLNRIT
jgi:hypothetical protein